jgi:hypothetical protein
MKKIKDALESCEYVDFYFSIIPGELALSEKEYLIEFYGEHFERQENRNEDCKETKETNEEENF